MMTLLGTYPYQTLVALLLGCIYFIQKLKKGKKSNLRGLPLPPGPKGYPLIGNLFDFPIANSWLVYEEWCKTYGKHFKRLSRILLNSWSCRRYCILQCPWQALFGFGFPATDHRHTRAKVYKLLGQAADAYGGGTVSISLLRQAKTFIRCRMGWDFAMPLMPYGLWWKKHRRSFQQYFHANEVHKYQPIQKREIHAFLRRLLVTPEDFFHHIYQ